MRVAAWLTVCVGALGTLLLAAKPATQPAAGDPALGRDILNMNSLYRWHVTLRKPVVAGAAATQPGQPQYLGEGRAARGQLEIDLLVSPPPPAGWRAADFEDGDWPHASAAQLRRLAFKQHSSAVVSVRGKFNVADPAAVKDLSLSLKYRGGVVVYVNGKELTRADLPAGEITPETSGRTYPAEAYVDAKNAMIPGDYQRGKLAPDVQQELQQRVAKRDRALGPVKIPSDLLRKGVNVLAIETHRSDHDPAVMSWFAVGYAPTAVEATWVPNDLMDLHLQSTGEALTPNVARPKGVQVWNYDRNDRVVVFDYGNPCEPLRPMKVIGARNGSFTDQIVIGSTDAIRGAKAVASDLKATAGAGVISAKDVTVLYGLMNWKSYGNPDWCDGLQEDPPAEVTVHSVGGAALLPVVVRIHVPKTAAPGDYRGQLDLAVDGKTIPVPIELHVADWAVPDPADYRTYAGIYQSPTSLAMQYKVKEWSEEHWKLMDKSFDFLARAGSKIVNITVSEQTQFGNDEGMIYWVKKADGTYDYDFTVFDRYMEMARKHCPRLDYVVLHVWHSGGWETRKNDQENKVTVLDPATGKHDHMQVPVFGTEESKKFWKPVLDQARVRLAKLGLDQAMCLGILSDGTASAEVFKAFNEIVPGGAKWARGLHVQIGPGGPYPLPGGGKVVLHEYCYGYKLANPEKPLPAIWNQRGWAGTAFHRIAGHETAASMIWYRTFPEQSLYRGTQGVGRICLDFWPVMRDGKRDDYGDSIYNRFPISSCAQRAPSLFKLTWPGPNGAETTQRFEALCEGMQDAEAAIVVSEAIDKYADKLSPELIARCRAVLTDRLWYMHSRDQMQWSVVYFHMNYYGFDDLCRRLYECAAEVSKKVPTTTAPAATTAPPARGRV